MASDGSPLDVRLCMVCAVRGRGDEVPRAQRQTARMSSAIVGTEQSLESEETALVDSIFGLMEGEVSEARAFGEGEGQFGSRVRAWRSLTPRAAQTSRAPASAAGSCATAACI